MDRHGREFCRLFCGDSSPTYTLHRSTIGLLSGGLVWKPKLLLKPRIAQFSAWTEGNPEWFTVQISIIQ